MLFQDCRTDDLVSETPWASHVTGPSPHPLPGPPGPSQVALVAPPTGWQPTLGCPVVLTDLRLLSSALLSFFKDKAPPSPQTQPLWGQPITLRPREARMPVGAVTGAGVAVKAVRETSPPVRHSCFWSFLWGFSRDTGHLFFSLGGQAKNGL